MKNKDLIQLYEILQTINVKGASFSYAIARNLHTMRPIVESLVKSREFQEEFLTYEKERIQLANSHAKKDEKGKPIIKNNNYEIEDIEKFNSEFKVLKKKHEKAIIDREKQLEDFNKLGEEKSDFEPYKIKKDTIPEELTTHQLVAIYDLIEE